MFRLMGFGPGARVFKGGGPRAAAKIYNILCMVILGNLHFEAVKVSETNVYSNPIPFFFFTCNKI